MTRLSDAHWSLFAPEQKERTRRILETLRDARIDFVLGGGWAVYAHESTTPSVDCDVFLRGRLPAGVEDVLSRTGTRIGPQRDLDLLPLDEPIELLGTGEQDLGLPATSYVPSQIFRGHLEKRTLHLDQPVDNIPVPDPVALAVTKLCALQGRSLAYRSFTDGEAGMRLGPSVAPQIHSLSQSYYLRKAGKDLFDVSLLLTGTEPVEDARALAGVEVWNAVRQEIRRLPVAIQEMARDLATRVGAPDPIRAGSLFGV
jgi:hypothetical protein